MKASLAQLARRRMAALPPAGFQPERLQQAKVEFFEALINRNQRAAKAASEVMAQYERPRLRLSTADQARQDQRTRAATAWLLGLRELRDEELRGVVRPAPTPEQVEAATALADRFKRWMGGDDSAGPFEDAALSSEKGSNVLMAYPDCITSEMEP